MFSFATVPVFSSADLKVTVQYLFASGFGVTFGSTGPTTSFVNVPVTSRSLSTAVFLSSAGVHLSNVYPSAAVVFGAVTSASVLPAFFNTYTVFSFATVPVAVSADLKVTVQYLFASGFGVTFGSTGPITS